MVTDWSQDIPWDERCPFACLDQEASVSLSVWMAMAVEHRILPSSVWGRRRGECPFHFHLHPCTPLDTSCNHDDEWSQVERDSSPWPSFVSPCLHLRDLPNKGSTVRCYLQGLYHQSHLSKTFWSCCRVVSALTTQWLYLGCHLRSQCE